MWKLLKILVNFVNSVFGKTYTECQHEFKLEELYKLGLDAKCQLCGKTNKELPMKMNL